jgi:hypothetical protein
LPSIPPIIANGAVAAGVAASAETARRLIKQSAAADNVLFIEGSGSVTRVSLQTGPSLDARDTGLFIESARSRA